MVRMLVVAAGAAALLGVPSVVTASERTGFAAIAAQDWQAAERVLVNELRIHPDRPELMINLAAVYARTGRMAEARHLYTAVLDRPAVVLDMPSGATRTSHVLAEAGLARSGTILATAR